MPLVEKDRELRRRRRRKAKLLKLRARLAATRDNKERDRLVTRIRKRSPNAAIPEK